MQRFDERGISLIHSGHFLVVGSAGASWRDRITRIFIGLTIKKNTVPAIRTNEMTAFIKCPYMNLLSLIMKARFPKSGTWATAAIKGVMMSATRALTTVPNAAPTTTPTAKSTTFPRRRNFLKSEHIFCFT